MSDGRGPAELTDSAITDSRLQLLIAEYTWVSGLIRYYREVELKALAATGLVLSGVGAAYAALSASENRSAGDAIGVVFAIAACITAFVLPVVLMANRRGLRAVVYVREWLHPLAAEMTGDARFLAWESVAGGLYVGLARRRHRHMIRPALTSAVVFCLIGAASVSLVIAAWTVKHSPWSRIIGTGAAALDLLFIFAAVRFEVMGALRENVPPQLHRDLMATAARHARLQPQRAEAAEEQDGGTQ
jgi:hypothetical protein